MAISVIDKFVIEYVKLKQESIRVFSCEAKKIGRVFGGIFLRLELVTRLGRGNGKIGCAINGGI